MKFWAIDSPVMRVLGRLGDIIILNILKCSVCGGDEDGKR